jgi:hypothetical protein
MDSQKFARPNPRIAAVVLGARTTISMALNLKLGLDRINSYNFYAKQN